MMLYSTLPIYFSVTIFASVARAAKIAPCSATYEEGFSVHQFVGSDSGIYADRKILNPGQRNIGFVGFNITYDATITSFTFNQKTGQVSDGRIYFMHAYFGTGDPGPVVMFAIEDTPVQQIEPLNCRIVSGQLHCRANNTAGKVWKYFQVIDYYDDRNLELGIGSQKVKLPITVKILN